MPIRGRGAMQTALFLVLPAAMLVVNGELPPYPATDQELMEEAGYFDEDGKYLGGIPKVDVGEATFDRCQVWLPKGSASSANTTTSDAEIDDGVICWEWNANQPKVLGDGDIIDNCFCFGSSTESVYCKEWTCNGVEIVNAEYCSYATGIASTTGGSGDSRRRLQAGGCASGLGTVTDCSCTQDDPDMEYCASWSCTITGETLTYERGICARVADSGMYCEGWTTETELADEGIVKIESCECLATSSGDNGVCAYSTCVPKSVDDCSICNFQLSVGLWGTLGVLGLLMVTQRIFSKDYKSPCLIFGVIFILGCAAAAVLYGGQDGGMYVGIMWAAALVFFYCCCRPAADKDEKESAIRTNR